MSRGQSATYRRPSRVERAAARAGALLPAAARTRAVAAYAKFLGAFAGDRLVADLPHGERVRLLPEYRHLTWNPQEYEAFRQDVRSGDTVLDVGANIGAYTVLFAAWAGPSGRVVAFEPAPEPHRALCELIAVNGVADRVTALQQAVTAVEGTARFTARGVDGANRIDGASPDAIAVTTTTVDATCARLRIRPRVIKVDAEGAELDVLRGARATIAAGGDDLRLYVEMHPQLWNGFGASRDAIEAELGAQGLRAERLDGQQDLWSLEGVCLRMRRCA